MRKFWRKKEEPDILVSYVSPHPRIAANLGITDDPDDDPEEIRTKEQG